MRPIYAPLLLLLAIVSCSKLVVMAPAKTPFPQEVDPHQTVVETAVSRFNDGDQLLALIPPEKESLPETDLFEFVVAKAITRVPAFVSNARALAIEVPYELAVRVTGYSSTRGQTDSSPHVTAWATRTRHGVIANNCWPLGTEIQLEGIRGVSSGIYRVEDTKDARYGCDWIDVWHHKKAAARAVGVQYAVARVVKYGKVRNPRVRASP